MAPDLPYTEDDIQRMLACQVHLGTKNCDFQMERYTYKRRASDGELAPSARPPPGETEMMSFNSNSMYYTTNPMGSYRG